MESADRLAHRCSHLAAAIAAVLLGMAGVARAQAPDPLFDVGAPAAAVAGGRLHVFARGTDGKLWYRWYERGWSKSQWAPLGGEITSAPAAAVDEEGRLVVFVRGVDGNVWFRVAEGAGWSKWGQLGAVASAPAVATSDGRLMVYARGDSGGLWYRSRERGAWSGSLSVGGVQLGSAPGIAVDGSKRTVVFTMWKDGLLWQGRKEQETQWKWQKIGGRITSAPSAMMDGATLAVFARGEDGALGWQRFDAAAQSWSAWAALQPKFRIASRPVALLDSGGTAVVFARGEDGAVYEKRRERGWNTWVKIGVPGETAAVATVPPPPAPAPSAPKPVTAAPPPPPAMPSAPLSGAALPSLSLPLAPPGSDRGRGEVQRFASLDHSPPWFANLVPGAGQLDLSALEGSFTGPVQPAPLLVQSLLALPIGSPGDLMRQYTNYLVPALRAGDPPIFLHTLQTQYLVSDGSADARAAIDAMSELRKAMLPETPEAVAKRHLLRPDFLLDVYIGKGAPEEMLMALALVYKHRDKMTRFLTDPTSTTALTDGQALEFHYRKYMGIDCNGFVSVYLGKRFKGPSAKRGGRPIDYLPLGSSNFRARLADVRPDDVLVFGKASHIAVVESVDPAANTMVVVESQADSRGRNGIIRSTYRVDGVTAGAEPLNPSRSEHGALQRFLSDSNALYRAKQAEVKKDPKLSADEKAQKVADLESKRAAEELRLSGVLASTSAHMFTVRPEIFDARTGLPYAPTQYMTTQHTVWIVPSTAVNKGGWY